MSNCQSKQITREELDKLFKNQPQVDHNYIKHGDFWDCYIIWNIEGVYWEYSWWEDHGRGTMSTNYESSCLLRRVKPVQKLIWENYVP